MKYIALILGIFGIELGIKEYIEKNKTEGITERKLGGALLIRKHHNRGAFLNAGQSRQKVVAALSVVLAVLTTIIFAATFSLAGKELLKWGLALLLGGAYSNTYDRLVRKYVVDYFSFNVPVKGIRRIIFNIGDFCIMIGAMLSVLGYYRQ
ncbi:MAG: signal peptidase II [Lachnospiraceae bacterium]|nr:signal peptidase II [Lachnospiraceae bacterium]